MSETTRSTRGQVVEDIRRLLTRCGATGCVSVSQIGVRDHAIEVDADQPVVVASVVKILIATAFARAVTTGRLDPRERVEIGAGQQFGGTGTGGCADPVTISLRDLALFMMSVSDNSATDVVLDRVGIDAVDAVIEELGLRHTVLRHDMESGARRVAAELGLADICDLDDQLRTAPPALVRNLAWLDPVRSNASTARETCDLLDAIWTDRAGPPQACSLVRALMGHQVTTNRLTSGLPADDVTIAAKTGTLPSIRNEAGVVGFPDGRSFAVAVFTRADSLSERRPDIDAAIGRIGALAVQFLRQHEES